MYISKKNIFLGVCIPGGLLSSAIKRSGYINGQEIAFILIKAGARVQVIFKAYN